MPYIYNEEFEKKLMNAIRTAEQDPTPPESRWYAVWDTILNGITNTEGMDCTIVNPQMAFRIAPGANMVSRKRYTDFGIAHMRQTAELKVGSRNIPFINRVPILVAEVKPYVPPNLDTGNIQPTAGLSSQLENAKLDLKFQIMHFFANNPKKEADPSIIGIATAGRFWTWCRYRRTPSTPAHASSATSTGEFFDAHPDLCSMEVPFKQPVELCSQASDKLLEEMTELLINMLPE
jgi:hypothetical protein